VEHRALFTSIIRGLCASISTKTHADQTGAVRGYICERESKQKDSVSISCGKNRVSEVMAMRCQLTLSMIRRLNAHSHIPAEIFIREIWPNQINIDDPACRQEHGEMEL